MFVGSPLCYGSFVGLLFSAVGVSVIQPLPRVPTAPGRQPAMWMVWAAEGSILVLVLLCPVDESGEPSS